MSRPDEPSMIADDATRPLFRKLPPLDGPLPHSEKSVAASPDELPNRNVAFVALRTAGELLGSAAVIVLLFLAYQLFVADEIAARQQDALVDRVEAEWEAPTQLETPQEVEALAVLRIPRLGTDYRRAVVQGTNGAALAQGPGHYSDTAMPGEVGNFAVAGHRDGRGSPFQELDELRPGDPVIVETADTWYVYRVLGDSGSGKFTGDASGIPGRQIVSPDAVQVISPTPNQPASAAASGRYLTLTTCHPEYSARQRLIVHAVLDGTGTPKSELPDGPEELREA
ncbi:class E sortase [Blastococcus haudaquaticus]|uniref:Sortase A n=1 Tax=Blastococcus haudaquaticus TaxID=1938745 RepID=A0A286GG32_9ACTN|nr:class E sortase [Blastococcus haudaquaticus]SOD94483.1 sortase A [Blastococcus haudaquaticus]